MFQLYSIHLICLQVNETGLNDPFAMASKPSPYVPTRQHFRGVHLAVVCRFHGHDRCRDSVLVGDLFSAGRIPNLLSVPDASHGNLPGHSTFTRAWSLFGVAVFEVAEGGFVEPRSEAE